MPSITHFQIEFDAHPYYDCAINDTYFTKDPVYRPGDYVSGHVLLLMNKQVRCRAVRLQFQGLENVQIVKDIPGDDGNGTSKTYTSRNYIINERPTLMGRPKHVGSSDDDIYLEPNLQYAFPFQFQIPPHALPTFNYSGSVYIKYTFYANVDRPWKIDYHTVREITVIPPVTDIVKSMTPLMVENTVFFKYFWLFNAGSLSYRIQLQCNTATIGGFVPISVYITAGTSHPKISSIKAVIFAQGKFRAETEEDSGREIIGSVETIYDAEKSDYVLNLPVQQPCVSLPCTISGVYIKLEFKVAVTIHFSKLMIPKKRHEFGVYIDSSTTSDPVVQVKQQPNVQLKNFPRYPGERDSFQAPAVIHQYSPKVPPPPYSEPSTQDLPNFDHP